MTSAADKTVTALSVTLYFITVLLVLPPAEYFRTGGLAALLFAAAASLAPRLGVRDIGALEVMGVTVLAALVLAMPTAPAMGGRGGSASWTGLVGAQVTALLWSALRWHPLEIGPRRRFPYSRALRWGAMAAAGLSVIATVPLVLKLASEGGGALPLLAVYPAYFVGAAGAATVFWLLQGVAGSAAGRYLIGLLCGICVYLAVAPIARLLRPDPVGWPALIVVAYVCASLVGPAVALSWD